MWRTDVQARLGQLAQAVCVGRPELFVASAAWSKAAFAARDVDVDDLRLSLACTGEVVREKLPPSIGTVAGAIVDAAIARLDDLPDTVPSAIDATARHADLSRRYLRLLLESRRDDALELVLSALRSGASFEEICLRVLCPAMREVGRLWHLNEIGVAEEHCATATTQMVMSQLLAEAPRAPFDGRVMIGASVEGNAHDVGVRIVSDLFEVAGWRAIYLGPGVPVSDLVQAAEDFRADLIALSASLVTHVRGVEEAVRGVRGRGLRPTPKIIVGGRAFEGCPDLATECGADAHASSPLEAVAMGERLVPRRSA